MINREAMSGGTMARDNSAGVFTSIDLVKNGPPARTRSFGGGTGPRLSAAHINARQQLKVAIALCGILDDLPRIAFFCAICRCQGAHVRVRQFSAQKELAVRLDLMNESAERYFQIAARALRQDGM